MRFSPSRQRGFTLMELLVVMTILALLATIGLVGYRYKTTVAREAVLKENLFQINHALEQYPGGSRQVPFEPGAPQGTGLPAGHPVGSHDPVPGHLAARNRASRSR